MTSRTVLGLGVAIAVAAVAGVIIGRSGSREGGARAAGTSGAAALERAREARATLSALRARAARANAEPGFLASSGVPPSAACLERMSREQELTHAELGALAKLSDEVPGLPKLRQAVFQVHVCVSCAAPASDYCARAAELLDQAGRALDAAR
ncbi:MAG: hypothetical protein OZ921_21130 [Sorangiineae bacterium]|nr:hypothetical protein [Polyangiaceae bacterium]MEB2325032.1 hypothetical protein [Sorangiineae bacterium]